MDKRKAGKNPNTNFASKGKKPGTVDTGMSERLPVFSFQLLDREGPYHIGCCASVFEIVEFLTKLGNFEKMNWTEIISGRHSHNVSKDRLSKPARDRLEAIKLDDIDELFSLRIEGDNRVWGIKEGHILRLLWWDPDHQVCPSLKA